jgi:hypothetical protein
MTRISVAHRPEVSSGADRILRIARSLAENFHRPSQLAQHEGNNLTVRSASGSARGPGEARSDLALHFNAFHINA